MSFLNSFLYLAIAFLLFALIIAYNRKLFLYLERFLKWVGAMPDSSDGKVLVALRKTFLLNWYVYLMLVLLWVVLFKIEVGKDMVIDYHGNLENASGWVEKSMSLLFVSLLLFLMSLTVWVIPFFLVNQNHSEEIKSDPETFFLGTKIKALMAMTVFAIVGSAFLMPLVDLLPHSSGLSVKKWLPLLINVLFFILFLLLQYLISRVSNALKKRKSKKGAPVRKTPKNKSPYIEIIRSIVILSIILAFVTGALLSGFVKDERLQLVTLPLYLLASSTIVFRWLYYTNDTRITPGDVKKAIDEMLSGENRKHSRRLFVIITIGATIGIFYYFILPSMAGTNTLYVLLVVFAFMILYLEWLRRIRRNATKMWARVLAWVGILAFLVMPFINPPKQFNIQLVENTSAPDRRIALRDALRHRLDSIKSVNDTGSIYIVCGMGGGSRAGYFTAGFLQLLDTTIPHFFDRTLCYSTISGSSPGVYHFLKARQLGVRDPYFMRQIYQRNYNSSGVFGFLFGDATEALLSPLVTSLNRLFSDSASPNWYYDRNVRIRREYDIALNQAMYFGKQVASGKSPGEIYELDYGYRSFASTPNSVPDAYKNFFQSGASLPIHFINTFEVNTGRRTVLSPFNVPVADTIFFENAILPLQDKSYSKEISSKDIMYRDATNLSELFPFLSGASTIGDNQYAQFVDGGYFENYGLTTAWNIIQYVASIDSSAYRRIKVILIKNSLQEPANSKSSIQLLAPLNGALESPFTGHANHQLQFFWNNLYDRFFVVKFDSKRFKVPLTRALTQKHIDTMNYYLSRVDTAGLRRVLD